VDLLLDGAGGQQPVDLHRPGLADPVGPVGGLVLDGRVPPAVVVEDPRGPREVQPARGPRCPGTQNSRIDHSSASRFSIGVPVSATRSDARSSRAATACWAAAFLTFCASSRNSRGSPAACGRKTRWVAGALTGSPSAR